MNPEASRLLFRRLLHAAAAALVAAAFAAPADGQNLPVMVGQDHESAVATLKARGISYKEEALASSGRRITYAKDGESVTLEFASWPADPNGPPAAFEPSSSSPKRLTLTRIVDLAPSSGTRRAWVNGLARDGHGWSYLSGAAETSRPASERAQYPVAAGLQWTKPPASFLFQAARAAGTPPGSEATSLEIVLENPHRPRRF